MSEYWNVPKHSPQAQVPARIGLPCAWSAGVSPSTAYRRIIAQVVLSGGLLISAGCKLTPVERTYVAAAASLVRDARIVKAQPIASEYQNLAAEVLSDPDSAESTHHVTILEIGDDALLARLHLIRSARASIDVQSFIWVDDDVGTLIFEELLQAARRGVKVRVLVDHFCATSDPQAMAETATAHVNLDVKIYNPIFDSTTNSPLAYVGAATVRFSMLNQRMHNKLLVVDDRIAIVSGRNIQDRYFDRDPRFNFRDRGLIVVGGAVSSMQASFDEYWDHELARSALDLVDVAQVIVGPGYGASLLELEEPDLSQFTAIRALANQRSITSARPSLSIVPAHHVEFIADHPEKSVKGEKHGGVVSNRILDLLRDATHSVVGQTPYLVLNGKLVRIYKRLRKDFPDLDLTFSTNSLAATDKYFVYAIAYKQRKTLVKRLKSSIYEFMPIPGDVKQMIPDYDRLVEMDRTGDYADPKGLMPIADKSPRVCIHAKSLVVDRRVAYVGSHNFDPRSDMNTECGVLISDERVAGMVTAAIRRDAAPQNSWVVAKQKRVPVISGFSDFFASISRVLPIFDIWPFRYATCYTLREGMEPRTPHDPDFMDHYVAVGQFPQVDLSVEQILTLLISAFGGWGKPLV